MIERLNAVDAVIGLPANIFYGTGIPTAILVLRKNRNPDDEVLFIDASEGFEKGKNQNRLRPEDIDRVVTTWADRTTVEKYSRLVSLDEIGKNDYNLNIARYVSTGEDEEPVVLADVEAQLRKLERESTTIGARLGEMLAGLGLVFPAGDTGAPTLNTHAPDSRVTDIEAEGSGHA